MKANPGDNFFTVENIITAGAFIWGCGIWRAPGDKLHAR